MGREAVATVTDGKFDFRTWEQIFYGEFDGMRNKRVLVKIIGVRVCTTLTIYRIHCMNLYGGRLCH